MLQALGQPAHMHFIVSAASFDKLVTHTFDGDDPWIESDAVFGVKDSLIDHSNLPQMTKPFGERSLILYYTLQIAENVYTRLSVGVV